MIILVQCPRIYQSRNLLRLPRENANVDEDVHTGWDTIRPIGHKKLIGHCHTK